MKRQTGRLISIASILLLVLGLACGNDAEGSRDSQVAPTERDPSSDTIRQPADGTQLANCYSTLDSNDICYAIEEGNVETVRNLAELGADPNAVDDLGESRLVKAVLSVNPNPEVMRILVEAGADGNVETRFHGSLLNAAISTLGDDLEPEEHARIVEMIVNAGADVNGTDYPDNPPDYPHNPLGSAVNSGNVEIVRVLVDAGADPTVFDRPNDTRVSIISGAFSNRSEYDSWEIVRILVNAGADPNASIREGKTLMGKAAATGNIEALQFLLDAGVDPHEGLQAAFEYGNQDAMQILFDAGVSPNSGVFGTTLLKAAVNGGDADITRFLIEAGADVEVNRPLTRAIQDQSVEIVRILVNAGADVDTADDDGYTPLTGATYDGNVEIVRILVNAGADPNAADLFGEKPLYVAKLKGHSDIIWILTEAGAVEASANMEREAREPEPTDSVASSTFDDDLYGAIRLGEPATVRALVDAGVDVNAEDSSGRSMLEWAIMRGGVRGFPEIVRILVDAGADVNAQATAANSLLQLATMYGNHETVQILTDAGAKE